MKICLITQQYQNVKSGVGVYANNYIDYASKTNNELVVIHPNQENSFKKNGVSFFSAKKFKFDLTPNKWMSFSFYAAKEASKIKNIDIFHFTDAKEAIFFKKFTNYKIGNVNDSYAAEASLNPLHFLRYYPYGWYKRYLYYLFAKIFERIALNSLDLIIANTKFVKKSLEKKFFIKQKVIVIYKTIKLSKFINKKINKEKINHNLLFVGTNFQRKGLIQLIKVMKRLIKKYPDTKLFVIGKDPYINTFIKLVKKINLSEHIYFLGKLDINSIIKFHKKCDFLIVPSLIEAFGLVYLEAMAMGNIAIGGKYGGTKELIHNYRNGVLVNSFNINEIYFNIDFLFSNPQTCLEIKKESIRSVKKYSHENMFNLTFNCYKKLSS